MTKNEIGTSVLIAVLNFNTSLTAHAAMISATTKKVQNAEKTKSTIRCNGAIRRR
jgi:hypothetical protein